MPRRSLLPGNRQSAVRAGLLDEEALGTGSVSIRDSVTFQALAELVCLGRGQPEDLTIKAVLE
uniref:hypothetical protein n=1 Tax=Cupriavidus yeoncheonensis TaxID=1462994 RepID=UPI003F494F17